MKRDNYFKLVLVLFSFCQMGVASIYLNSLSRIENWSAVYAEDSKGYILVADHFLGADILPDDVPLMRYRLFSPFIPFLASIPGRLININISFVGINIILWIIAVLLFYELLKRCLKDNLSAFAGGLILTTSLPFIQWGLPVMTDMGAYFFAALVVLLYPAIKDRGKYSALYGLLIGAAILTKPTLITLLFFATLSLFSDGKKLSAITVFTSALVLTFGVYFALNLSLDDFRAFGLPRHRGVFYFFSAAIFCFHWGWIFFFKGWKDENILKKYHVIYLASFIAPYLVFVHNPRLFFLAYPAVIPFIVKGIRSKYPEFKKMLYVTFAYVITSNVLSVFHLYIMRTLSIRDLEAFKKIVCKFILY